MASLRSRYICFFLLALASSSTAEENKLESSKVAAMARMKASVKLLASDEWDGRGVGTEGIDEAADYIAKQFAEVGLDTELFDDDGAFQKFTITSQADLGDEDKNQLAFVLAAEEEETEETLSLKLTEEFSALAIGSSGQFDAEVVFVGYGITAEDLGYDDYADIDVDGKVVVMLRKEPQQNDADSPFAGKRSSPHATFQSKVRNAADHGAVAVVMVNDALELTKKERAERRRLDSGLEKLANLKADFEEQEEPDGGDIRQYLRKVERQAKSIQESARKIREGDFDRALSVKEAGTRKPVDIPVFFALRDKIDEVIQHALGTDLESLEAAIDKDFTPCSAPLTNCRAEGEADIVVRELKVKNVVGVLEGDGSCGQETIVIGAHYDHLGNGGPGSLAPWTVDIHNGADDNASGTATLIELARRFASRETKPRRRMVFIAFTGEERGLLGSAHYVRNPRFALEETVAMVNLDMVGRLTDNMLTIYGTGTAKEFEELVDDLNAEYKFDVERKPGGYGPSDHASFYPKKIPVLFFFTGLHSDYHRPSDDWDKLNYEGMTRIADMATEVIEAIDGMEERPEYVKKSRLQSFFGEFGRRRRRDSDAPQRAFLGVTPAAESEEAGLLIEAIVPDGPAAKAKLEVGDRIVQIGEKKVSGLADVAKVLADLKPGEKVKVTVVRDNDEIQIDIELGESP